MNDLLYAKLKALKLSGIVKTIETRNEEALKDNISYMEFLELLINDEVLNRQNNSLLMMEFQGPIPKSVKNLTV